MFTVPAERLFCTATTSSDHLACLTAPAAPFPRQPPAQHAQARRLLVCAAQQAEAAASDRFDVGAAVISPAYRSTPWEAEAAEEDSDRTHVRPLPHVMVPVIQSGRRI